MKMKPLHTVLIIIGVVALLGATYYIEQEKQAANQPSVFPMGTPAQLDDTTFTVQSKTETKEYNGYSTENKFVIVSVEVENNGKEPLTISGNQFVLVDEKGNNYENDGMRDIAVGSDNPYFSLTDSINPGLKKTGNVSFEIPESVTNYALAIRNNMFDFGGAEYIYFDLRQ